jgi:DivIVA domain-containing protein
VEVGPRFGSVRRGYDPGEVDAFLIQVASAIRILEARIRDAPEAPEDAPQDVDERLAARFAGILAIQESEAENLLSEAHLEAEAVVAAAGREAEEIRADGKDAAERSIDEAAQFSRRAAEEADQLRVDLDERRADLIAKLPQIQQRLVTFLSDLEKTLESIEDPDGGERSHVDPVVDEHSSTTNT